MTDSTLARITALSDTSTPDLKAMWKEFFNFDVPPKRSRAFLIHRLSYRIQELAQGGLTEKTNKKLKIMIEKNVDKGKPFDGDKPSLGTQLFRTYQGIEHQVTVKADGFEYQGRKYRSLSKIARVITGTQWNGKVFFGLKKKGQ